MRNVSSIVSSIAVAFVLVLLLIGPAMAAIDYSSIGSTHSQTFDTLASSNTFNPWTNDVTLIGWHLFRRASSGSETPPVAVTDYDSDDGTSNNGKFYSFGTTASSDRALGGIAHPNFDGVNGLVPNVGNVAGWIAASIANNTGGLLDSATVMFNGEQWLDGGNDGASFQQMEFEYGIGASFDMVSLWTAPGGNFNWTSPLDSAVADKVIGNTDGLVAGRGGVITNLNWANGQILWLRWIDRNDGGADHGLAIDDFSFSATAVPEPSAALFGGLVGGLFCLAALAKRIVGKLWRP